MLSSDRGLFKRDPIAVVGREAVLCVGLLNDHPELWRLHALLMDANRTLAAVLRRSGEAGLADKAESEAEMHRSRLHEGYPDHPAAPTGQ